MLALSNTPNPRLQHFPVPDMKLSLPSSQGPQWLANFPHNEMQLALGRPGCFDYGSCHLNPFSSHGGSAVLPPWQQLSSFSASVQVLNFPCCMYLQFTQFSLSELTNSIWERYKIGRSWENGGSEWPAQGHKVSSCSGSWPWGSAESPVGQSKLQLPHSTPCLNTSKHENSLCDYTLSALKDTFSDPPWQQGDSMTAYWCLQRKNCVELSL